MYFIHVSQERDQWRALVNTVMNLGVTYKAGKFMTIWGNIALSEKTAPRNCFNWAIFNKYELGV
jgi:hypothetical protein